MSESLGNAADQKKWALVEDGVVLEVTTIDPAGRFHADLKWFSAPDDVEQRMAYNGKSFYWPSAQTP